MKRLLVAGRTEAAMALARRAIWGVDRVRAATVVQLMTARAEDVLERVRATRPELVSFASEIGDGPLGTDPAAMQLACAAHCPVLLIAAGRTWPPRRVVLPVTTEEVRSGSLREVVGWVTLIASQPDAERVVGRGHSLEVLHVAGDADEWNEGREALRGQIAGVHAGSWVTARSCMRFGSPVFRRALRALSEDPPDLTVLIRPRPGGREGCGELPSEWTRMAGGCRSPLLVLPAAQPEPTPGAPLAAGFGRRNWLEALRAAVL